MSSRGQKDNRKPKIQSLKRLIGSWEREMEVLHEKLKLERPNLRGKLIDIFNRATPEGKSSFLHPWGKSREILLPLLDELDKNGFPGAFQVLWAFRKSKNPKVTEMAEDYIYILDVEEINEESFSLCSGIQNDECEGQKPILIPGLPNEISISCIAKVPVESWGSLISVSKPWLGLFTSGELYKERKRLKCQEEVLLAKIDHFQEKIIFSPKEECWRWFPRLKIVNEVEILKEKLGVSWDYDARTKSSTIQVIGSTGKKHTFKSKSGMAEQVTCGDGKLAFSFFNFVLDRHFSKVPLMIVNLETMESQIIDVNLRGRLHPGHPIPTHMIIKDEKLYCFGYEEKYGRRSVSAVKVDLKSGIMKTMSLPERYISCGFLVCGKIFSFTIEEEGDDDWFPSDSSDDDSPFTILSLKLYDDEEDYWNIVKQLPTSDEMFGGEITSYLEIKVIENKFYIIHKFGEDDDEKDPLWFVHVLSVSVENGKLRYSWELQFSKIKDPRGNSPSELKLKSLQVIEL